MTAVVVAAVPVALWLEALWLCGRVVPPGRYLICAVSLDLWIERWKLQKEIRSLIKSCGDEQCVGSLHASYR